MSPIFMLVFFIIVFFIIGLVLVYNMAKKEKRKLIDEMWKNKEITDQTYKKYIKQK
jgi:preprotein translocase subunit SecG